MGGKGLEVPTPLTPLGFPLSTPNHHLMMMTLREGGAKFVGWGEAEARALPQHIFNI